MSIWRQRGADDSAGLWTRGSALLLRRKEIVCQQAVEMISDYLEQALSRADKGRLERHLRDCPHCTSYLDQMRQTLRLTGRLVPDDLSPEMQDEFSEVFRRWQSER